MLTFDEFFKKKRIDLAALQKAEPALFSEFKTHFEQMGEKSFDHTKKYWFNKTRRQFPLAVEAKTEKVHIANPLAEQTITESLTETEVPTPLPKTGFTPRFKAGAMAKPAEPSENKTEEPTTHSANTLTEEKPAEAKVGFTPRFKMKPKVEEEIIKPTEDKTEEAKPVEALPKVGFTPRFKMKPKVETIEEESVKPDDDNIAEAKPTVTAPKVGFTPRFKMKPNVEEIAEEAKPVEPEVEKPTSEDDTAIKPAYKPRFNIKNIPPKE